MVKTAFTKKITLVRVVTAYGHGGNTDLAAKTVRAHITIPTATTSARFEAVGRKVELFATIRRDLYRTNKYTHAEYEGVRYHIDKDNAAEKEMFVRLSLSRG